MNLSLKLVLGLLIGTIFLSQNTGVSSQIVISEKAYKLIEMNRALIDSKKYNESVTNLTKALKKTHLSNYEKAQLINLKAYSFYLLEKPSQAISEYNKILNLKRLPENFSKQISISVVSILINEENYKEALDLIQHSSEKSNRIDLDWAILKARVLYFQNDFQGALQNLNRFLNANQSGKYNANLPNDLLLLAYRCHFELKQYADAVKYLTLLITTDPKTNYLKELANLHSLRKEPIKQLAITEILYDQNQISEENQLINYIYLLNSMGNPYKAALVIDQALAGGLITANSKNLGLSAKLWLQAHEIESAVLQLKLAAPLAGDGNYYFLLSNVFARSKLWENAEEAITKSLNKGLTGSRKYHAILLRGQILYRLGKHKQAKKAFLTATRSKTTSQSATSWLSSYDSEGTNF